MSANSTLNFNILARDKASPVFNKFGREVKQSEKATKGLASGVKTLAKGFLAFTAVQKATDFIKESIVVGREAQKTTAQTAAVIKSTGGAAKVTAKQFDELAHSISMKTAVDKVQIQAGENMLATFTNVRNEAGKGNDIFTRATKIAVDMGVALKKGPVAANLLLGKALQDPIKGMGKLGRLGVYFTDQQKKQAEQMVKTGDVAGAQGLILAELGRKYAGSAKAQATAADKFHNSMTLLKEQIGTSLLPALDQMAKSGTKAVAWLQKNPAAMKSILVGVGLLAAAFAVVVVAGSLVEIGIAAVVAGIIYANSHFKWFHSLMASIPDRARVAGLALLFMARVVVTAFHFLFKTVTMVFGGILRGAAKAFGWVPGIGPKIKKASKAFDSMKNTVNSALTKVESKLRSTQAGLDSLGRAKAHPRVKLDTSSFTSSAAYVFRTISRIGAAASTASSPSLKVSAYAVGTISATRGMALVGEHGPELVSMRGGEHVYTNRQSMAMMSGGGSANFGTVTVVVVTENGRELQRKLLTVKRTSGGRALGLA